jgi:hypothetical protein
MLPASMNNYGGTPASSQPNRYELFHRRCAIHRLLLMFVQAPVVIFLIVLAALIDIITKTDDRVKHLPKIVWILLVILLPLIGSIIWFAVGREYAPAVDRGTFGDPRRRNSTDVRPLPVHLGRPKTTEEQLADLDDEIERYNAQARIDQLEAELKKRRDLSE